MIYLGAYNIGNPLTFYVNTHDIDGSAVDADAPPTYRIYEEATATPLASGSMALLDDGNTVGFYYAQVTLATVTGFEVDKCYCVRIAATVGGAPGATIRTFQVTEVPPTASGVASALAGSAITPRTYVQREHVELFRGDSYQSSEGTGRRIAFLKAATETHWPTTLDTVHAYINPTQAAIDNGRATAEQKLADVACTVTQATGDSQAFYFELTSSQTDDLSASALPHDYAFQIIANKADHPATLREGTFSARQTLRSLA